jgi:hypothetical protein
LAHKVLLKLGKKISKKPEWKGVKGKEVEEFLKHRENLMDYIDSSVIITAYFTNDPNHKKVEKFIFVSYR